LPWVVRRLVCPSVSRIIQKVVREKLGLVTINFILIVNFWKIND